MFEKKGEAQGLGIKRKMLEHQHMPFYHCAKFQIYTFFVTPLMGKILGFLDYHSVLKSDLTGRSASRGATWRARGPVRHSGPETGKGGQNSGHVSTSRVVK